MRRIRQAGVGPSNKNNQNHEIEQRCAIKIFSDEGMSGLQIVARLR
jgi:hypothetical protein